MTRRKNEDDLDTEEGQTEMSRIPDSMTVEASPDGQAEFNRPPNSVSEESEAEAIVIEAPVAPVELVVASDNPLTDDIVNKDAKPQKAVRSHITVVYVGDADTFSYGPYKFRPGQPAKMPSVIAEELLTYPFEKFEVKE